MAELDRKWPERMSALGKKEDEQYDQEEWRRALPQADGRFAQTRLKAVHVPTRHQVHTQYGRRLLITVAPSQRFLGEQGSP